MSLNAAAAKPVSIDDVTADEGDGNSTVFTFTVTCDGNTDADDTVYYTVYDGSATADTDYVEASGTVNFAPVSDTATISITVNGDTTPEADETFTVIISNLDSGDNYIDDATGIGTIVNDDTQAWPPIMGDIPNQVIIADIIYTLNVADYVTEVNGDAVTYSLSGSLPTGLSFNTATGLLSGTPTDAVTDPPTAYDLNVTASDVDGSSATDSFTITVDYGFCYGYSYSQENTYFTESNTDGHPPMLVSGIHYIDTDYPIDMTIYLRHRSNIDIRDLNVSVLDINTTQVKYARETTELTANDSIIADPIPDASMNVADEYIKDLQIGDIDYGDYYYIDYDLDPQIALLDTPINVELSFNAYGTSHETMILGSNIPLCSASTGAGYAPVSAIFNVVHNDYYNASDQFYNLPTQVVKREGNFSVIALEPDSDTLKQVTTLPVAVELIDVNYYGGDIEAACQEPRSAITPKVWLVFDNNVSSMPFTQSTIQSAINSGMVSSLNGETLTIPSDFYNKAYKNVAFRTSYNYAGSDEEVVTLSVASGPEYNVDNFSDAVKIGECVTDVDGKPNNSDMVAQFCDNAGAPAAMTPEKLRLCMECVYGLSTKLTCSKDNFAIRPEAFLINMNDQNQTNPVEQPSILSPANLAAGYNYNIKVNATSHIDNNESLYKQYYTKTSVHKAQYIWNGPATGCNDDSNKTVIMTFLDGLVDENNSLDQVGHYMLNITDNTWTAVDSDPIEMAHHTGAYFKSAATKDCIGGNTVTQVVNYSSGSATPFTGCNISSSHTNPNPSVVDNDFYDYNATFHPYKFNMSSIVPSHSIDNSTAFDADTFIYMSDMSQDENMSFHLNGPINASGYNDSNLSNFTENCYAKPITLSINKSTISGAVAYKSRFNSLESNGTVILPTNSDINNTGVIDLNTTNFKQNMLGSINSTHNLNFDRNLTEVKNPEELTFSSYDANCTIPNDCNFSADLTSKTTQGVFDLNQTIKHYYGRTHASTQRYEVDEDAPYIANIYYEVYCSGDINGSVCDPSLLQNPTALKRTDDVRWFINPNHTSNKGTAGTTTEKDGLVIVTGTTTTGNHPDSTTLTYNGTTFPYITTMENTASGWLLYPTEPRNQFQVHFLNEGNWTGENETDVTTKKDANVKTNRRSMW